MKPGECRNAGDVDALARSMFGAVLPFRGVSHVTATWDRPGGGLWVMAIGDETPESEHDFFMLNLSRARADAILVTGKVLRDEPTLRYDLQGPGKLPEALAEWRHTHAGRSQPPLLIVLTSGRGLDPEHPALSGEWARPVLFTSDDAELPAMDARVVRTPTPDARSAIRWAQSRGATIVSLEAGPSTVLPLYEKPSVVDELLLGVCHAPSIPPELAVAKLRDTHESLGIQTGAYEVSEWTFSREIRSVPDGATRA